MRHNRLHLGSHGRHICVGRDKFQPAVDDEHLTSDVRSAGTNQIADEAGDPGRVPER